MINVDLSKAVPHRAFVYLAAFLPGLFFEICLLLGNPGLIAKLVSDLQRAINPGGYLMLGTGVFLAFVIGNAFMLVVALIQHLLGYVYRFWFRLKHAFCKQILLRFLSWVVNQPFGRWPSLMRLHRYAHAKAFPPNDELRDIGKCWWMLARKLLKDRYGTEPGLVQKEWEVLYWHLGAPTSEDVFGSILVMACHAIGWSGLAAVRFAPALRGEYFFVFCIFLVAIGLHHDFYVARRRNDPLELASIRLRALLREYRSTPIGPDDGAIDSSHEPELDEP